MHAFHTLEELTQLPTHIAAAIFLVKIIYRPLWVSQVFRYYRRTFHLLKWAVPPNAFCTTALDHWWPGKVYWAIITIAWVFICLEDDGDDWWRKQAHKAAGRVKDLGHRLIIVNRPSPA